LAIVIEPFIFSGFLIITGMYEKKELELGFGGREGKWSDG
jgi:hypothetical protein